MHYTETVYRNPYWPTFPLLQITQGCTHNACKFCTMYKDVEFKLQPMEWIEEDLKEIASVAPDSTTIQLLSANPLCMTYGKLKPIFEMINKYLPKMEYIYASTRVTDITLYPERISQAQDSFKERTGSLLRFKKRLIMVIWIGWQP